jgi:hydrogenase-4 membrane subunit HyfE
MRPLIANEAAAAVAAPVVQGQIDLTQVLISLLCTSCLVIAFFMVRTLRSIDQNQRDQAITQKELFDRMHAVEKDFYELLGEHKGRRKNDG